MGRWGRVAVGAALLSLSGCEQAPRAAAAATPPASIERDDSAAAPAFDYRYAFRLPPARVRAVQDSHARGCERLGVARCRIVASRYRVGSDNKIGAVLTLRLDPAIARGYGQAAAAVVANARGALIDSDIAGVDSTAAGRGDAVLAKLRQALANAETSLRTSEDAGGRVIAVTRAARLRAAIATIAEVDPIAASSAATAPMVFTYASGGAAFGLGSSDASFDAAGRAFLESLGGLAVLLAGVGPWIALLLGGALLLRRFVHPAAPAADPAPPRQDTPFDKGADRGNVIQRWFHKDPENVD